MSTLAQELPPIMINLDLEDYEGLAVIPWFSYRAQVPVRPFPGLAERPAIQTERLTIRPIVMADLEAFHALRSCPLTQIHSPTRGRTDNDIEETRAHIEWMESHDQEHYYFGAFLNSTGELIGEGGLPKVEPPRSGWPEAEILIKPDFRRQGFGTEFWKAVTNSWWELPREMQRHQLLPLIVPGVEPGEEVQEGLGLAWEESNVAAREFFAKVLKQNPVSATGSFEEFDRRPGRDLELIRWNGTIQANPLHTA
ncbi:hypothetical protein PFICI_11628 [Pestalotiopsis fici W106-1]|uniref:N-acetyltransferase domain-containing protein n=1 Tax=Pestalotiopsis fici (strain W106-1 / CGMCC3.15140) TaxID=1229662 RepID=W3WTU0_PESFW|nr:uncharacterized protein PFICI_11628 [Pestalotiopsis fici W106-1]ETS76241.1 hypothetical protein PFICI_11628 [Pestalotiopsis fici W106-1]